MDEVDRPAKESEAADAEPEVVEAEDPEESMTVEAPDIDEEPPDLVTMEEGGIGVWGGAAVAFLRGGIAKAEGVG